MKGVTRAMAVLWTISLLVLAVGLSLGQTSAQDDPHQSSSSLASEIGVRWTQGDAINPEAGRLSDVIQSAFGRVTALVETFARDIRSRAESFSLAIEARLGSASLGSAQRAVQPDSVPVDRLGFLVLGMMSATGCITVAARRYWYGKFWQPECLELSLRIQQLEASSPQGEAEGAMDLHARSAFWDAVPQPPTQKVAPPDIEYVKMLVKLGYHRDAQRILDAIEHRAIPA